MPNDALRCRRQEVFGDCPVDHQWIEEAFLKKAYHATTEIHAKARAWLDKKEGKKK